MGGINLLQVKFLLCSLGVNVLKCINTTSPMFPWCKYISGACDISSSASHQSPAKQSNHCNSYTLLNTASPQPLQLDYESKKYWFLIYNTHVVRYPTP